MLGSWVHTLLAILLSGLPTLNTIEGHALEVEMSTTEPFLEMLAADDPYPRLHRLRAAVLASCFRSSGDNFSMRALPPRARPGTPSKKLACSTMLAPPFD